MNDQDPRQVLASRLRALREEQWPGVKVNQAQLAKALGSDGRRSVSVPLISSWESQSNPTVPPAFRIQDIATFFATPRSFDGRVGQLLRRSRRPETSCCRNSWTCAEGRLARQEHPNLRHPCRTLSAR